MILLKRLLFPLVIVGIILYAIYWNYNQFTKYTANSTNENYSNEIVGDKEQLEKDLNKIAKYENDHIVYEKKNQNIDESNLSPIAYNIDEIQSIIFPRLKKEDLAKFEELKKKVQNNKEEYSKYLKNNFDEAIKKKNQEEQIRILTLATVIPLGISPLYDESENVLKNMAIEAEPFNEVLFKSAYQFHLTQAIYRSESEDRMKNELFEIANSEEMKNKLIVIFDEIKLSSTEREKNENFK
jgi:lipopolysaccharide export LptBFGC system permease protein LptF